MRETIVDLILPGRDADALHKEASGYRRRSTAIKSLLRGSRMQAGLQEWYSRPRLPSSLSGAPMSHLQAAHSEHLDSIPFSLFEGDPLSRVFQRLGMGGYRVRDLVKRSLLLVSVT